MQNNKMKLTIKDRVYLPNMLPKEGGIIEMISVREVLKKTEITSKEIEECGIRDSPQGVTWDKDTAIEVEFTEQEIEVIHKGVKALDEAGKITLDALPTAEKLFSQ